MTQLIVQRVVWRVLWLVARHSLAVVFADLLREQEITKPI